MFPFTFIYSASISILILFGDKLRRENLHPTNGQLVPTTRVRRNREGFDPDKEKVHLLSLTKSSVIKVSICHLWRPQNGPSEQ